MQQPIAIPDTVPEAVSGSRKLVFACAITDDDVYRECAEPGIKLAAEPDSEVFALESIGSIFSSYNAILERAAGIEELEALVLVHQDAEIMDADFCAKARAAFADPDVGVAGCVGAVGVRSLAWWEGSVSLASFSHRHLEHGGGDLPGFSWDWDEAPPYARDNFAYIDTFTNSEAYADAKG